MITLQYQQNGKTHIVYNPDPTVIQIIIEDILIGTRRQSYFIHRMAC